MSNKSFAIAILVFMVGLGGYVFMKQSSKPKEVILGTSHPNQGNKHIARGESHEVYNSDPASSGSHCQDQQAPISWGVYVQEIPKKYFCITKSMAVSL